MNTHYLYIMDCIPVSYVGKGRKERAHYAKIGVTNNLEKRLQSLQTGNPEKIRVRVCFKYASKAEAYGDESVVREMPEFEKALGEWIVLPKNTNVYCIANSIAYRFRYKHFFKYEDGILIKTDSDIAKLWMPENKEARIQAMIQEQKSMMNALELADKKGWVYPSRDETLFTKVKRQGQ
jgi:hypothetical protein